MSVAATPKPSGARPPFNGPPIETTFDGSSHEPDPELARLAESVNRLLATVDHTPNDRLDVLLSLLQQRKRWVENELSVERLLADDMSLPPIQGFTLDFLLESQSKEESACVRLLNNLDHGIFKVQARLAALNGDAGTSDS